MGTRRLAREHALQILYQWDLRRDDLRKTMSTFWEVHQSAQDAREFTERLVCGTVEHLESIDPWIVRFAKNWRLERMETLDRNLLRMAVEELLYQKDTPSTVVINEAIELAHRFSTAESSQFVNAVLDSIRKEIEGQ